MTEKRDEPITCFSGLLTDKWEEQNPMLVVFLVILNNL